MEDRGCGDVLHNNNATQGAAFMANFPISLNAGNFDAFKKVLANCALYAGDIAIKSSHIIKLFDAEACMWLTGDMESVLGPQVDMSLLLDKGELRDFALIEGDYGVSIDFVIDKYTVNDGITSASITYYPPTDFEDEMPPAVLGLPTLGTKTEFDEEDLARLIKVCKKRGPIELCFDDDDELFSIRNNQRTILNVTASRIGKKSMPNESPKLILLSNFLESVQGKELVIEVFQQHGVDDVIRGNVAYWAKHTIRLGIKVELIVFELLMALPEVMRDDFKIL